MQRGRIMFFCAPCGFGKTTVAKALLKNKNVIFTDADKADFGVALKNEWEVLAIDNLQMTDSEESCQQICEILKKYSDRRFVFLSRGEIPGWLMPFAISGLVTSVGAEEMFFSAEDAAKLFKNYKVDIGEDDIKKIHNVTLGYPAADAAAARHMADGERFDEKLAEKIKREMFLYFEEAVYNRFELPIRRFLLEIALFEEFDAELAKMVSGSSGAGAVLMQLHQNTSMMFLNEFDNFRFWDIFREFLLWEQKKTYTSEQIGEIYGRGGLYFELKEDYGRALECYLKGANKNKISELLIKSAYLHPGMGHYEEMQDYYLSLSDEQIKESPALMQAMSMLCALRLDYETSQMWYDELKRFAEVRKKSDAAAKEARGRIAWLDISLPQKGVGGLIDKIGSAFKLMTNKEIDLPTFSVTSGLPSIMNGGKDFSDWSKKDDFLYATMKLPVQAVLGKDGVGLADCAIAESKFEKGEDISARMLSLIPKISEIQSKGTADIEFALVGLLARMQIDSGRLDDAQRTVLSVKERFEQKRLTRFAANIDAFLCRIALLRGDMEYVRKWYEKKAPRDMVNLQMMKRYVYFTQAMAEIALGDEKAAFLTLSPLENYCIRCERHIDMIYLKIIRAAAKFKTEDVSWREDFKGALEIAGEYGFVRPVSCFGAAVLDMFEQLKGKKKTKFYEKLDKAIRLRAVYYPDFLKSDRGYEKLTDAELFVLRLMCADKSNLQIGQILNIKVTTVKSHVSHILQKLGVSRRSEAKTAAQRLRLI